MAMTVLMEINNMRELNSQEVNEVHGGGVVYDLFYWLGQTSANWDNIEWSEVDTSGDYRE